MTKDLIRIPLKDIIMEYLVWISFEYVRISWDIDLDIFLDMLPKQISWFSKRYS
jgi:hypothetical protein